MAIACLGFLTFGPAADPELAVLELVHHAPDRLLLRLGLAGCPSPCRLGHACPPFALRTVAASSRATSGRAMCSGRGNGRDCAASSPFGTRWRSVPGGRSCRALPDFPPPFAAPRRTAFPRRAGNPIWSNPERDDRHDGRHFRHARRQQHPARFPEGRPGDRGGDGSPGRALAREGSRPALPAIGESAERAKKSRRDGRRHLTDHRRRHGRERPGGAGAAGGRTAAFHAAPEGRRGAPHRPEPHRNPQQSRRREDLPWGH